MGRAPLEQAYPGIAFRPRTRNWWARLTRVPPECVHLETEQAWMAMFIPDTLYLRGKAVRRGERHDAERPGVSLCRACLLDLLGAELAAYRGRVVAFEPDRETFSQYFFIAPPDFDPAGLRPEVAAAISGRLSRLEGACGECSGTATWLWLPQREVTSLDEVGLIETAPGRRLCREHGAAALCGALEACAEANLFYVNAPYGESGAYIWI